MFPQMISEKKLSIARAKLLWLPLLGAALMTASSYVAVPMYPVPITTQTLTVLLLGVLAGPRLGGLILLFWIILAAIGLPVLSGGTGGIEALTGPTAGYIAAFPVAAYLAGRAAHEKPFQPLRMTIFFTALHGLILSLGWAWLSSFVGPGAAIEAGVLPFLIGVVVKSVLAVTVLAAWRRLSGDNMNL